MAWFPPLTLDPLNLQFWTPHPLPTQPGLTKDQCHGCLFLRRITTTFQRWIRHLDLGSMGMGSGWATRGVEKKRTKMWATKKDNPSEFVFYFLIRGFNSKLRIFETIYWHVILFQILILCRHICYSVIYKILLYNMMLYSIAWHCMILYNIAWYSIM